MYLELTTLAMHDLDPDHIIMYMWVYVTACVPFHYIK